MPPTEEERIDALVMDQFHGGEIKPRLKED
jgi:hypothetical protein